MVSADKPDFNPLPGLPPSPLCHFTSRGGYPFFLKKKEREREKVCASQHFQEPADTESGRLTLNSL